ncbi:MAG: hypothetical protein JWQ73_4331 [Variovorax sp.]|nr:hypothetical protein [Variovorax sp.]
MRIGISVLSHKGQNVWENGIGQNVFFLARLFQRLPFVRDVVLIDVGDQASMPPQVDLVAMGLRRLTMREATDEVDVIIEMAGALDAQWLRLMRARGKKVAFLSCGQPYASLIEPSVFEKPSHLGNTDRCDEVWLLPEYAEFAPMMRTLNRCPAYVAPYIWQPHFLEQRIEEVAKVTGIRYGYRPRALESGKKKGFRVAIFEPNISVAKTSSISLLACDEAYRADPSSVQMLHALNTLHMTTHPTMLYLANSLDLVKQHKAVFLGRHDIVGYMAQHADAVISHQWHNDQNYSYLDALYGNYPLIHNSPWLRDVAGAGYYYPGFEAAEGGRQLRLAAETHETQLGDYRIKAQRTFAAVDPFNRANLDGYAALLLRLQGAPA